jgi:hypothetical protein
MKICLKEYLMTLTWETMGIWWGLGWGEQMDDTHTRQKLYVVAHTYNLSTCFPLRKQDHKFKARAGDTAEW